MSTYPHAVLTVVTDQADQPDHGNPYSPALYEAMRPFDVEITPLGRRELLRKHDIIHIHFPELIVRWDAGIRTTVLDMIKVLLGLRIAKWRGARIVWTGHDLGPHDMPNPRLYGLYVRGFGRLVDLLVSLSDDATRRLTERYPWLARKRTVTIPHGHYRDLYPAPPTKSVARKELDLDEDAAVFLLFGQIRRYKDVPGLVRAFGRQLPDARLLLAGAVVVDESLTDEVRAAVAEAGNVSAQLRAIPSVEVPLIHAVADVVVLPYAVGSALNSGAAFLALSMGRPVVVRESGTMRELQRAVGGEWLRTFEGPTENALAAAVDLLDVPRSSAPDMSSFDWDRIGHATADAFYELAGKSAPPAGGDDKKV